jgi:hypothetical protein
MARRKLLGFLIYNGAIPTGPEVDELLEKIGIPEVGTQITYSQISAIIGVTHKDSRWKSIVTAWRKELQDNHKIVLSAIPNEGFDVLDDNGKTGKITGYMKKARNNFNRAGKIAVHIERNKLTDENKVVFDHYNNSMAALRLAEKTMAKPLDFPELDRSVNGD